MKNSWACNEQFMTESWISHELVINSYEQVRNKLCTSKEKSHEQVMNKILRSCEKVMDEFWKENQQLMNSCVISKAG